MHIAQPVLEISNHNSRSVQGHRFCYSSSMNWIFFGWRKGCLLTSFESCRITSEDQLVRVHKRPLHATQFTKVQLLKYVKWSKPPERKQWNTSSNLEKKKKGKKKPTTFIQEVEVSEWDVEERKRRRRRHAESCEHWLFFSRGGRRVFSMQLTRRRGCPWCTWWRGWAAGSRGRRMSCKRTPLLPPRTGSKRKKIWRERLNAQLLGSCNIYVDTGRKLASSEATLVPSQKSWLTSQKKNWSSPPKQWTIQPGYAKVMHEVRDLPRAS